MDYRFLSGFGSGSFRYRLERLHVGPENPFVDPSFVVVPFRIAVFIALVALPVGLRRASFRRTDLAGVDCPARVILLHKTNRQHQLGLWITWWSAKVDARSRVSGVADDRVSVSSVLADASPVKANIYVAHCLLLGQASRIAPNVSTFRFAP